MSAVDTEAAARTARTVVNAAMGRSASGWGQVRGWSSSTPAGRTRAGFWASDWPAARWLLRGTRNCPLFVIVTGAFIFAGLVTTKEIGVGITVAVLIDATFMRLLLVPATMRLLGHWN